MSNEVSQGDISPQLILNIANEAGMLILENGGETFRAEETVIRICRVGGYPLSEVFALPTGMFITLADSRSDENHLRTSVSRVKKHDIDLSKLEQTNSVARQYTGGQITAQQAYAKLIKLKEKTSLKKIPSAVIAALATAFFTVLYGGSFFDCVVAMFCGYIVQMLSINIKRTDIYRFAISLLGGMAITAVTVIVTLISGMGNLNVIITGAIIPLLPGLAMTNAIRDTMMGDLVSGISRFAEVLLTAVALAGGVGAVLSLYVWLGGVI